MNKQESAVILDMVSYRPIEGLEEASRFLGILEHAGGIYVPEVIGDKERYKPGDTRQVERYWIREGTLGGLLLQRKKPFAVHTVLTIAQEQLRQRMPHNVFVAIDAVYFDSSERLKELVDLGCSLYDHLMPCCGFIQLPWMPRLHVVAMPDRGLPDWAWATWLGPEYAALVDFPGTSAVSVTAMSDGGRLFLLPFPENPTSPDTECFGALEYVRSHTNPRVFQSFGIARSSKQVQLPHFRFRNNTGSEDSTVPVHSRDAARDVRSSDMSLRQIDASQTLLDLIFLALDHGIDSVRNGDPLVPFVIVEAKAKRSLQRYAAGALEEGVAQARQAIRGLGTSVDAYAFTYDGYVTVESQRFDAIIVEGGERGKKHAVRFTQRYRPKRLTLGFETFGNPAYLGECEQLLVDSDPRHETHS